MQEILQKYKELQDIIAILGMDELSEEDKLVVSRAMRERGSRSRVSQVIRRHVYGLNGSDGTALGGCDTLLQSAHLRLQRRLVTNRRRHTAKQRGHLGTCLCKTE